MLPLHLIKQITPAAAKLYLIFLTLRDQDPLLPLIHASLTKLARASGFSERTCQRAVNQLLRLQILRRLPRGLQTPHSYILLPIPDPPANTPPMSTSSLPTATPVSIGSSPDTTPVSTSTPSTTTPVSTLPRSTPFPDPKNPTTTPMSNFTLSNSTPDYSPLSIVLNLCTENFDALPPETHKLRPDQINDYVRHLYSLLTPEEKTLAIAAAQAHLARHSPETLQKVPSETP